MVAEADILAFVSEQTGCPTHEIDPCDLLGSTGWDGDDAFELIEAYGDRFGVDLSNYVWDFHHHDEGSLTNVFPFVKPPHDRVSRIPISAAMLAKFAHSGRWNVDYPPFQPIAVRRDIWPVPVLALAAIGAFVVWYALAD